MPRYKASFAELELYFCQTSILLSYIAVKISFHQMSPLLWQKDDEKKVRVRAVEPAQSGEDKGKPPAGTLAEFYEAQARRGRDISAEERMKLISKQKTLAFVEDTARLLE